MGKGLLNFSVTEDLYCISFREIFERKNYTREINRQNLISDKMSVGYKLKICFSSVSTLPFFFSAGVASPAISGFNYDICRGQDYPSFGENLEIIYIKCCDRSSLWILNLDFWFKVLKIVTLIRQTNPFLLM